MPTPDQPDQPDCYLVVYFFKHLIHYRILSGVIPDTELGVNWYAHLSSIAAQDLFRSNDTLDEAEYKHACVAVRTAAR